MAVGIWPDYTPGSEYGPCLEPCQHTDCAAMREKGPERCARCGEEMQSGEGYFFESNPPVPVHAEHVYAEAGH